VGYPDPKNLKIWAGIIPDPDDETNPSVPLFNWDDIDLAKPVEKKATFVSYSATVEITMHEDEAHPSKARLAAIKKFVDMSGCAKSKVRKANIRKKEKNILFSSIKIVYTVEVVADKEAVTAYYRNKTKGTP
jgi:hypothetical protein